MADVICNFCGHPNNEGSNFCSSCGQPLERVDGDPATITFSLDPQAATPAGPTGPPSGDLLVVTHGPNSGSQFPLEHVITTAGRHPDSDIFLDDVTVSRHHVEVERTTNGYLVRDVGSLNGTYVNRRRIGADTPLEHGDEVQVGRFKLLFLTGSEG